MSLILIIRNEHKMAFSPLKIIPLPAQNCLFTVQNWLTNFYVSQLKNWSPRLFVWHLMKYIIFWWAWYVCSWRPNVIYWRQKMYWNPFSIFPFRPNYVILEMYLPLPHTKIFVEMLKEMWFVILKNMQSWTFTSLHCLLETLQSKLQLKSPGEQNQVKVMCHNFGHLLTRVPLWTICDSDVRENEKSFGQFGNRPKTFAAVSRQICQNDIFQFQIIFYVIFHVYDRGRGIYWMKRGSVGYLRASM